MPKQLKTLVLALAFGGAACMAAGCSSGGLMGSSSSIIGGKKKSVTSEDGGSNGTNGTGTGANGSQTVTSTISSDGAGMQVKNTDLLRSSITTCMGPNMLAITADMLLPADVNGPAPAPLTDGKIRFLIPAQFKAGDDIITDEAADLVDAADAQRTSAIPDSLSSTYMSAAETVANVVAHNCTDTQPQCQCGTQAQAITMMTACLPELHPKSFAVAQGAALIASNCSTGPAGMRKAVASMLASEAFITSR